MMPRNQHGNHLAIGCLEFFLDEARRHGAKCVFISAAGTLVLTTGRTMDPRRTVGHIDVEAGELVLYESEGDR